MIVAVVALLFHVYVGLLGLVTLTVAVPFAAPHVVAVDDIDGVRGDDEATDTLVTAEQPLLVTVTVYVLAATPVIEAPDALVFQ